MTWNSDLTLLLLPINILLAIVVVFMERRNVAATWSWLMVLLFVPVLGFVLYMILGQNLRRRKLYRFSPDDYKSVSAVWKGQAMDGSGPLEVVDGPPDGGKLAELDGAGDAFTPEYHPEEIFEMAQKLYRAAR